MERLLGTGYHYFLVVWMLTVFTPQSQSFVIHKTHPSSGRTIIHHRPLQALAPGDFSGIIGSSTTAAAAAAATPGGLELPIACWTAAFSTSHIGMSAIRNTLIEQCGNFATFANLVNRPGWRLPDIWPGDEAGQEVFPTPEIAGRQLYRIGYTVVSFVTLGTAFGLYLQSLHEIPPISAQQAGAGGENMAIYLWIATFSWATSIASLFNPSPLSLVPVYEEAKQESSQSTTTPLPLRRNDSKKLSAYGMTRITRHPLILPAGTWALATAMSMGGTVRDWCFFGILAIYAITGCAAQDLRVVRKEGSVGTVFTPEKQQQQQQQNDDKNNNNNNNNNNSLDDFFQETSFVPFGAVWDGRQSMMDIVKEVPWLAVLFGLGIGYELQTFVLEWLSSL